MGRPLRADVRRGHWSRLRILAKLWSGLEPTVGATTPFHDAALLNHFGRLEEDCWRNREAESFGSLEVDDQLEPRHLVNRQICRLGPVQNFIHVWSAGPAHRRKVPPVGKERSSLDPFFAMHPQRETSLRGELDHAGTVAIAENYGRH